MINKRYWLDKLDKSKDSLDEICKLMEEFQPALEQAYSNEGAGSRAEWDDCVEIHYKIVDIVNDWVRRYNELSGQNQPLFQKLPGWISVPVYKAVQSAPRPNGISPNLSASEKPHTPDYVSMGQGRIERSGVVDYLHINGSKIQLKDYNSYTGEATDYDGNKYKLD